MTMKPWSNGQRIAGANPHFQYHICLYHRVKPPYERICSGKAGITVVRSGVGEGWRHRWHGVVCCVVCGEELRLSLSTSLSLHFNTRRRAASHESVRERKFSIK
jgi:hypothetical protein